MRTAGGKRVLGAPLALAVAGASVFATMDKPAARAAGGEEFSAESALRTLAELAAEPRPIGSEAHARARGLIRGRLVAAGAAVTEQQAAYPWPDDIDWLDHWRAAIGATEPDDSATGTDDDEVPRPVAIANVIGTLEGGASTGVVLFVAHYDSRSDTPGAADDGAAVAALLDVVDLVAAGPRPRNDLVFLFSDGEELGLLGAQTFARDDAAMERVRCVVNFDAIGNAGPLVLFQTGPGSGELIRRYASCVPKTVASSIGPSVYERLPNDTDLTPFLAREIPALNLAVVGGASAYHQAFDLPESVAPGTVQIIGDTALALARELGALDLRELGDEPRELVFYDVLGRGVVTYGSALGWCLLVAAVVALLVTPRVLDRRRRPGGGATYREGARALAGTMLATTFFVYLVWAATSRFGALTTGVPTADIPTLAVGNLRSAGLALAATCALGVGVACLLLDGVARTEEDESSEARLDALLGAGAFLWALLLVALALLGVAATAQLPVVALLVCAGRVARERFGMRVPIAEAAALALLAPHFALPYFLRSMSPAISIGLVAASLPLGIGLFGPWLTAYRPGRRLAIAIVVLGVALLLFASHVAHLGR